MPTPPKPFSVISSEKRSHRTKAELLQRKKAEEELLSGTVLKSTDEVKNNEAALKEYVRINKLFKKIGKNDALYESVINRYCMIYAECKELVERREFLFDLIKELKQSFKEVGQELTQQERADYLLEFSRSMSKMTSDMLNVDRCIQQKRKMLLDIEKENIMTVASALRSVPKKAEKKENPLLKALNDS